MAPWSLLLLLQAGELYKEECEAEGLAPPENITNIPVTKELVRPAYYAKYTYAINSVACEVIGCVPRAALPFAFYPGSKKRT